MDDSKGIFVRPQTDTSTPPIGFGRSRELTGDEIVARRQQAREQRASREAYWLKREAEKYGLKRHAKPISAMPA